MCWIISASTTASLRSSRTTCGTRVTSVKDKEEQRRRLRPEPKDVRRRQLGDITAILEGQKRKRGGDGDAAISKKARHEEGAEKSSQRGAPGRSGSHRVGQFCLWAPTLPKRPSPPLHSAALPPQGFSLVWRLFPCCHLPILLSLGVVGSLGIIYDVFFALSRLPTCIHHHIFCPSAECFSLPDT